jgi:hypothetical protein
MPIVPLSPETRRRLDALFAGADRDDAAELLVTRCGEEIPGYRRGDQQTLERIRFAALKLSDGDLTRLETAIHLAEVDFRDLLMAAGFGLDVRAHESWFPKKRTA